MSMWRPLGDTLAMLVESVTPAEGCGLTVTEADLEIPLEFTTVMHGDELVVCAIPPHSRWRAGFLPPTHAARLSIRLVEEAKGGQ